jgi:pyrroline-5-carboxylate reductase
VEWADIVLLAVKPQIMPKVWESIKDVVTAEKLVISVAAGIPVDFFEGHAAGNLRISRVMPNTPCLIKSGASAFFMGHHTTDEDLEITKTIFEAVGLAVGVDEESLLDAVTGLSGSGPAYIFLMIDALADAGVNVGIPRRLSQTLSAQTVLGSAKLLLESGRHPGELKDMVTSPGGTAIAGLHVLEAGGLRATIMNAVEASTLKSRSLGE